MPTLTICRGISGSGKSTWTREQSAVVISRDLIRTALFGSESMHAEGVVTAAEDATIEASLLDGHDVIVDDTNITWKYVVRISEIGHRAGASVGLRLFDVPLHEALARNALRGAQGGRRVPDDVIRKQHHRLQGSKNNVLPTPTEYVPYERPVGKPRAIIVDIDGTLAHHHDRSPYDWKRVGEDTLDETVAEIVDIFYACEHQTIQVILMSGRDGSCRAETLEWLDDKMLGWNKLLMREAGDMRKDNIVKYELFDEHIRDNFDVLCVLDDRNQVVEMWRKLGLTCLQVAEGAF